MKAELLLNKCSDKDAFTFKATQPMLKSALSIVFPQIHHRPDQLHIFDDELSCKRLCLIQKKATQGAAGFE